MQIRNVQVAHIKGHSFYNSALVQSTQICMLSGLLTQMMTLIKNECRPILIYCKENVLVSLHIYLHEFLIAIWR